MRLFDFLGVGNKSLDRNISLDLFMTLQSCMALASDSDNSSIITVEADKNRLVLILICRNPVFEYEERRIGTESQRLNDKVGGLPPIMWNAFKNTVHITIDREEDLSIDKVYPIERGTGRSYLEKLKSDLDKYYPGHEASLSGNKLELWVHERKSNTYRYRTVNPYSYN